MVSSPRGGGPIWVRLLVLLIGVFACSTSVIMIKACTVPPVLLAGYRLVFATLLLLPAFWGARRRHGSAYRSRDLVRSLLPGVVLALHFVTWATGARWTHAANASLLVNMTPVALPFFLWFVIRERINRGEFTGTLLALAGVLLLGGGDYVARREFVRGDAVCFFSMLLFAWYLVLARRNRDIPSVWLYLVPLYGIAGLFCFAVATATGEISQVFEPKQYLFLVALALVPTITGHTLLNVSMRHLRGQIVGICNQAQFLFAGTMAFFFFGEVPAPVFALASLLIVGGAALAIRAVPASKQLETAS